MLSPSKKHPNEAGLSAQRCVMFFLPRKNETSPGASPVFLFWIPVTFLGVIRYSVTFVGWPVSPAVALKKEHLEVQKSSQTSAAGWDMSHACWILATGNTRAIICTLRRAPLRAASEPRQKGAFVPWVFLLFPVDLFA